MLMNKLHRAYTTAWRWPEVYTRSPSVIWTSRIIAFLVPIALVVLTVLTGVPIFGWTATGVIAGVIGLVMVFATVKMFHEEFSSVEDFQSREARIKEFFHGFPALTEIPVIENEPDEWVAYGHVEPQTLLSAIQTVIHEVTEDEELVAAYSGLQGSVEHLYARFVNPDEGHWSEGLELCRPMAEGCFRITRISK